MKPFGCVFALVAAAGLFAVTGAIPVAVAEEIRMSVQARSGVETSVRFATYFNNSSCQLTGLPSIVGISSPSNGKVFVKKAQHLIDNPGFVCAGRYMTGTEIFYRSKPKFVGTDETVFDIVYPGGTYERIRATIEVAR